MGSHRLKKVQHAAEELLEGPGSSHVANTDAPPRSPTQRLLPCRQHRRSTQVANTYAPPRTPTQTVD